MPKSDKIPETNEVVATRVKEISDGETLPAIQSPMDMISMAIQRGAGEKELAIIERMFEFDLRVKAQAAKEAYFKAMSNFASDPPEILKNKTVSFGHSDGVGETSYSHASLDNVAISIQKKLSPHGLHASWKTDQGEKGMITVTCSVSHELGHAESTSLSHSPDSSGKKNSIQAIGSTITYLQRYTILALTGLATKGQDDDGTSIVEPEEKLNDSQYADIVSILQEIGKSEQAFCKYKKVKSLNDLPFNSFEAIIKELEGWRK